MDKTLYSASILIALLLMAGSAFFPNDAVMWLAATSVWMDIARSAIVLLMIGLISTKPPRSLLFRSLLALGGIVLTAAAVVPMSQGSIHVLDMLLAAESAVAFFLAAIEAEPAPQQAAEELPAWTTVMPRGIVIPLAIHYAHFMTLLATKIEESASGLGGSSARRGSRLSSNLWISPGPPP